MKARILKCVLSCLLVFGMAAGCIVGVSADREMAYNIYSNPDLKGETMFDTYVICKCSLLFWHLCNSIILCLVWHLCNSIILLSLTPVQFNDSRNSFNPLIPLTFDVACPCVWHLWNSMISPLGPVVWHLCNLILCENSDIRTLPSLLVRYLCNFKCSKTDNPQELCIYCLTPIQFLNITKPQITLIQFSNIIKLQRFSECVIDPLLRSYLTLRLSNQPLCILNFYSIFP